ncbi:hypothetical protein C7H09_04785 [Marinobacter fuscus]|uniref:Uncharacterized protein n=1 Tax=Marinobacter fuscus TaxID=2109942 RepID=A0A2T1KPX5_9GAMM|nr:hypothetical protein [Marinobacter fuscus]PSF12196.1 hypothetical protein C7H09_04785 [Marinobacter fuscus]
MTGELTPQQISRALFETDPLNTCCRENDCTDEYDYVAQTVYDHLQQGEALLVAMTKSIGEWFFDGKSFNTGILAPALAILEGRP